MVVKRVDKVFYGKYKLYYKRPYYYDISRFGSDIVIAHEDVFGFYCEFDRNNKDFSFFNCLNSFLFNKHLFFLKYSCPYFYPHEDLSFYDNYIKYIEGINDDSERLLYDSLNTHYGFSFYERIYHYIINVDFYIGNQYIDLIRFKRYQYYVDHFGYEDHDNYYFNGFDSYVIKTDNGYFFIDVDNTI